MTTPRILPNPSGSDDTATLQAALDALSPGQLLVGQPGAVYLHSKSLNINVPGTGLAGTRLHATNPDDQAVLVRTHGVTVQDNDMTAVTKQRGDAPWEARISVWGWDDGSTHVSGARILGNTIRNDGGVGTDTQNGAKAGGIFISNASNFEVRNNIVKRTCSDAIHITGGSSHGIVTGNQSIESGDDGIAVVSYMGRNPIGKPINEVRGARGASMCSDILVEGNTVRGQYWGRGATVVGGRQITVRKNSVSRIYGSAGIMIAREEQCGSWGVSDIVVEDNDVFDIQIDQAPLFCPTGPGFAARLASMSQPKSNQAGIELHSTAQAADVALSPDLFVVGWVTIRNNRIGRAPVSVRVGADSPAGTMRLVNINDNVLESIWVIAGSPYQGSVTHIGNKRSDGTAITTVANAPLWRRESAKGARIWAGA